MCGLHVLVNMYALTKQNMHSLDSLQKTDNSCRDQLWLRLVRQDCRKLMSTSSSSTFLRCSAVAKLEDTLDQSSVVGYKCKAIQ